MIKKTVLLISLFFIIGCAGSGLHNTQNMAMTGAATGALIGQLVGHDTEGTLLGLAIGTVAGVILGFSADSQENWVNSEAYYLTTEAQLRELDQSLSRRKK